MSSNSVQLKYISEGVYQKVPSRGLGDSIEKFTKFTGIKKVVDKISEVTNTDCGCNQRRDKLNKLIPYGK